jgi:hypothetical protein
MLGEHGVVTTTLRIDPRYCGPPGSANGGYAAGRLAAALDPRPGEAVEVTLLRPVPVAADLVVAPAGANAVGAVPQRGAVELRAGTSVVAAARVVPFVADPPAPVDFDAATDLVEHSPMLRGPDAHPFPMCFVCGTRRERGDGMRLFPARVPGRDVFAVAWQPAESSPELAWAALDCPSSFPMYLDEDPFEGPALLGRLTAEVRRLPAVGERCVVMSWRESVDGRKMFSGSALYGAGGDVYANARATWIRLVDAAASAAP